MIRTQFVHPPIPVRTSDWIAFFDGQEEGPFGCGASEEQAVADLLDQIIN